jgi:hypothetical protein
MNEISFTKVEMKLADVMNCREEKTKLKYLKLDILELPIYCDQY